MQSPTQARIDLGALRRNLAKVRERSGERRVIGVIKADAYGHGAVAVGRALAEAGCDALAVATTGEARVLRDAGVGAPLFLLQGMRLPEDAERVLELAAVPLVSSLEALPLFEAAARRAGRPLASHLKLDTGMSRLGLLPRELEAGLEILRRSRDLRLEGVCSHLADADDPDSPTPAAQRSLFSALVSRVFEAGFRPEWIHLDNSAGMLSGPSPGTTAVRPGIVLYGVDPSRRGGTEFEPVMTLVTRVTRAKLVPAGTRVGYGGTYTAPAEIWLLTLPIGYADGLPRAAGPRFEVGLDGRRLPLAGRVSMDLAAVAAGPPGALESPKEALGREVLIFGRSPELVIPVDELAEAAGTIAYEILTGIGPRVERIVVES